MKKHVFYIGILSMLILSNCREDEQFNNKEHLHKNTEVLYRNSDTISIPNRDNDPDPPVKDGQDWKIPNMNFPKNK